MFKYLLGIIVMAGSVGAALTLPAAADGQYSIKTMTPQVEQALENRRGRYDELDQLKVKGLVGENNHGYAQALSADNQAKSLVDAENADRKVIYQTIAEQNGLTGAMITIEKVFAQVQADKASSGEMIQTVDGDWIKK